MESINYEYFEQLLQTKAYKELTDQEREFADTLVSGKEEYELIRRVTQPLPSPSISPRAGLLADLQAQMPQKQAYHVPAWAASVALLICASLFYWLGQQQSPELVREVHTIEQYLPSDTVFLTSAPDTIYIQQVKYIEKMISVPVFANTQKAESPQQKVSDQGQGMSWAESEALDALVVRGE